MERGARVVVIALAAAWLAAVVRFRMSGLMEDEEAHTTTRDHRVSRTAFSGPTIREPQILDIKGVKHD